MKMMKWAQQQKDTSLSKVKDPTPSPDDEEEKESYTAENTPIGHTDDERNMIRKELYQMAKYAKEMFEMLEDLPADSDFPHWWQAKVVNSLSMISKAKHYLENELNVPDVGGDRTEESIEEGHGDSEKLSAMKQACGGEEEMVNTLFSSAVQNGLDDDDFIDAAKRMLNMSASEVQSIIDKRLSDTTEEDTEEKDNQGFSDKEIKMAFGVLNDPRYKGGNYSGAVEVINKIAPGLADHPSVKKALQRTNEAVCSECGKARFVAMPEHIQKQYESVTEEKQKGIDGKVCWKGYKRMGTKMKGGKRVDNCVKM